MFANIGIVSSQNDIDILSGILNLSLPSKVQKKLQVLFCDKVC